MQIGERMKDKVAGDSDDDESRPKISDEVILLD